MLKTVFVVIALVCFANRALFGMEEYKRLAIERNNDLHMYSMCEQVDYKKIGRHAQLCADLERRLQSSIFFHTTKAVVDDTLYREATLNGIAQTGLVIILLCLGSTVYNRYVKLPADHFGLPQVQTKGIKQD
jgi:hypothetical protein